jgi:hypothetical protein
MTPLVISLLVLVFTFGGVLVGMWLRERLPPTQMTPEAKDTVRVAVALVSTMTALVLGLVTAAAKSDFDSLNGAVRAAAADILSLDRTLARMGPDTKEVRQALHDHVRRRLEATWPEDLSQLVRISLPDAMLGAEQIVDGIRRLPVTDEADRRLRSRALDLGEKLLHERWMMASALVHSVPVAFLTVLVFWLGITFLTYGLFAPRGALTVTALLVCAISVSAAMFLILEMDGPFDGWVRVSPDSLKLALERINQ